MKEITKYIADDGTEFEYEDECQEYEWKLNLGDPEFVLMNGHYSVLDPLETKSYEDAEFIFIPNLKSVEKLWHAWDCDLVGTYRPEFLDCAWVASGDYDCECGLWAYDWDRENWYHVGKRLAELQNMADECMRRVNGV